MLKHEKSKRKTHQKVGCGIVNSLINNLPFEAHLPGYHYCGPGTKLEKRLARGDPGVNKLDEACKEHDIAYANNKDLAKRHEADNILYKEAKARVKSSDAKFGEKAAALGVAAVMKAKVKMGMGCRQSRKTRKVKTGRGLNIKSVIRKAKTAIKNKKFTNTSSAIKAAMTAARAMKARGNITPTRVIPVPKSGGILPLIPIFAGLSALGALSGGAAGIAKAVNDAKAAKDKLKEDERHNRAMEEVAMGKGLYLKPYKQGLGLFLGKKTQKRKSR